MPDKFNAIPLAGTIGATALTAYLAKRHTDKRKEEGREYSPLMKKLLIGGAASIPYLLQHGTGTGLGYNTRRYGMLKGLSPWAGQGSTTHKSSDKYMGEFAHGVVGGDPAAKKLWNSIDQSNPESVAGLWRRDLPVAAGRYSGGAMKSLSGQQRRDWDALKTQLAKGFADERAPATVDGVEKSGGVKRAQLGIYPAAQNAIPVSHTRMQLLDDPFLSVREKSDIIQALDNTGKRSGMVTTSQLIKGGIGAGLGYASASVMGRAVGAMFGGLETKTQKRLQRAGVIAGVLRGTGIWND